MYFIPFTTSPIGWLLLGISGYSLYKAGKNKGADEAAAAKITEAPEPKPTKAKGDK